MAKQRHRYIMNVMGAFAAPIDPTAIHCGPQTKPALNFRWEVVIEARRLDDEGFVVDNAEVKNYFDAICLVDKSCEQLAEQICRDLWRPNFDHISVKLWGTDWANVACEWKADER